LLVHSLNLPFQEVLDDILIDFMSNTIDLLDEENSEESNLGDVTNLHNRTKNEEAFGFSCTIYCNFLPRFITTVNARFMGDLWGCLKSDIIYDKLLKSVRHIINDIIEKKDKLVLHCDKLNDKINSMKSTMKILQKSILFKPKNQSSSKKNYIYPISSSKNRFRTTQDEKLEVRDEKKKKILEELEPTINKLSKLSVLNGVNDHSFKNIAKVILQDWKYIYEIFNEDFDKKCFYNAVARQLFGTPEKSDIIRQKVLKHLNKLDNFDNYKSGRKRSPEKIQKYKEFHTNNIEYADLLIVEIASNVYKRPIYLYTFGNGENCNRQLFGQKYLKTKKESFFIRQKVKDPIVLFHRHTLHFDSIIIKKQDIEQYDENQSDDEKQIEDEKQRQKQVEDEKLRIKQFEDEKLIKQIEDEKLRLKQIEDEKLIKQIEETKPKTS